MPQLSQAPRSLWRWCKERFPPIKQRRKTVEDSQSQFINSRRHLCRHTETDPSAADDSEDLQHSTNEVDVPVGQVEQIPEAQVEQNKEAIEQFPQTQVV